MSLRNLDFVLRPRSIAVIGATQGEGSVGAAVMRNLLAAGFRGPVYPVHPTRASVAGVHAYRDVAHLPQVPDLGVICTPPETVPGVVRSLGAWGTRAAAVLTDGVHAEDVLREAKPHLMRILGPNSMGIIVPGLGIHASFAPTAARPGPLALLSQSGALLAAALGWAASRRLGFACAVSLGDAVDVDAADLLDFLAAEPAAQAVLLYLESVRNGRKFLSAARAVARAKPVIVMKSGRTPAGAEAALRHTGAQAGDDAVFEAALARAGCLRVATIAELFDAAETLARMRVTPQARLAIVTNAGGPGVVAADAAALRGAQLTGAPVDVGGDASGEQYAAALGAALAESHEDAVLVIHSPSGVVAPEAVAGACRAQAGSGRLLACWMGGERARAGENVLREAAVPVYGTPEAAVRAFSHLRRHSVNQEALEELPESGGADPAPDEAMARALVEKALAEGRERLSDPEGKTLLAAYGIPVVNTHVARNADEAARLAAEIGYPVALKVLSPDLEHRADVGGVMLNLENESEVRAAAHDIASRMRELRPQARLAGFTLQRMIRPPGAVHRRHGSRELEIVGERDAIFGMVLRVDGAVGLVPLNAALALGMLRERDARARAVADVLERLSQLLARHPEVTALAIDPLLADAKGAMALEVRMRVARTKKKPGEHLAIRPYPRELEERIELKDGRLAVLRPVRPDDAAAYAELVERSDPRDLRFRFFSLVRRLPARDLARYTHIDYDREMAFVAVPEGRREILGEVRIFTYPDGETAEFALLVRSDQQRQGLGRALLAKAIDYCRARGSAVLLGQISADNEAMLELARRSGMDVERPPEASLAVAHLDLRPPPPPEVKLF